MKTEIQGLQEELGILEEELAYQKRELEGLRLHCHRQETLKHQQIYHQKG